MVAPSTAVTVCVGTYIGAPSKVTFTTGRRFGSGFSPDIVTVRVVPSWVNSSERSVPSTVTAVTWPPTLGSVRVLPGLHSSGKKYRSLPLVMTLPQLGAGYHVGRAPVMASG